MIECVLELPVYTNGSQVGTTTFKFSAETPEELRAIASGFGVSLQASPCCDPAACGVAGPEEGPEGPMRPDLDAVLAAEPENLTAEEGRFRERVRLAILPAFKRFIARGLVKRLGVSHEEATQRVNAIGDGSLLRLIFENWDKILELILRFFL
ncbi:MAG TPA: hypothetical protein VM529_24990 [Gemmata sp.]|jgi:hypothetical protein|nr:hypothetical protein [Gemmata sp.]